MNDSLIILFVWVAYDVYKLVYEVVVMVLSWKCELYLECNKIPKVKILSALFCLVLVLHDRGRIRLSIKYESCIEYCFIASWELLAQSDHCDR